MLIQSNPIGGRRSSIACPVLTAHFCMALRPLEFTVVQLVRHDSPSKQTSCFLIAAQRRKRLAFDLVSVVTPDRYLLNNKKMKLSPRCANKL
jgi:hypothetical protein